VTQRTGALPTLALLGVTAAWGSTFFMIKDVLEEVSVADFLAVRFAIAAAFLFAVAPGHVRRLTRDEWRHSAILGLVYGVAQILQTAGLERTPATVSGFVTGMYVVLTPVLAALVFRERITRTVWIAVALATVGLAFLSLKGFALSGGVVLIFCSAILYAVHILGLGRWSKSTNAVGLAAVQMAVIAVVCTVVGAPNGIGLPESAYGWTALLYMAIVAAALSMLLQTWAQAHLAPTRAAIIMTMEPVFAAFFAVLFGGESLTGRMVVGGAFVLAAMYLVELAPRRKVEAEVTHLTV
jgi:drug/metabolite transporter (DMT)-like permease